MNEQVALNAADAPQLANPAARVIDPILTTAARGYMNPALVFRALFPVVTTGARGGTRIEFDRTDFRKVNTRRAPGATTQHVQFGHEGKKFALTQHRLMGKVPVETAEEAMTVAGIDLGMRTVTGVQNIIGLEREIHAAELVLAAATYDATHVNTLAGNAQWSNGASTPTRNVMAAVETTRAATGMRPNTVIMGGQVYSQVRVHEDVLQQIRYAGGRQIANKEDLARLWDVERVVVGDAIYVDEDDTPKDVWGKDVVIAYTAVGSISRYEPSFGYGYNLSGTPMVEQAYYDRDKNSWLYPVTEEWTNEVVGKDAGYLIKNAIA